MLNGKNILLGVTGGIAAYKAADLCSRLIKEHCAVDVVMTKNAQEFIGPAVFDNLTGNRTATDTFDRNHSFQVEHIALADRADLVIIAPATANVIAKLAHGIADDMLTTTVLACDCPKLIAPAMNTKMYLSPVTQDNLNLLRKYGWTIIEPDSGHLACGATGPGKLAPVEKILAYIIRTIAHVKDMTGLKVMVSAGPTQESLDPVRYLTNHSTGKMGYAIAEAAAERGAEVTLVSGPTDLARPIEMNVIDIKTAKEMYEAFVANSEQQDLIIKAAAVADYRPAHVSKDKIKKSADGSDLSIPLERTEDILEWLGAHKKPGQLLCGFSMETTNVLANSRKKLAKKRLDMIAANNLRVSGAGFGVETNVLTLITEKEETTLPLMSKWQAAHTLLDQLLAMQKTSVK
jgi:phosphopantothenoylcysteine decarboxylase/phosphopantothenate--cysteine ligase